MQRCTDELTSLPAFHIEKLQKLVGPAQEKITGINDVFQQANTFAPIIGSMLGANGNRTYLLAAQNTAEIRASGGFPAPWYRLHRQRRHRAGRFHQGLRHDGRGDARAVRHYRRGERAVLPLVHAVFLG